MHAGIAVCPQQALSWDGVAPERYNRDLLPTPDQIDELLKERRAIRRFKEKKIDRATLQQIVSYGIYAPTDNYHLGAIVVDDGATMEAVDQADLWHAPARLSGRQIFEQGAG